MARIWTKEEYERLIYLRDERDLMFKQIGAKMGIKPSLCSNMYHALKRGKVDHKPREPSDRKAPNKILIDRAHREDAMRRQTLTGAAFGDPPPGYSALDRRRSA